MEGVPVDFPCNPSGDADPAVDLVDGRLLVLSVSLLYALLLPLLRSASPAGKEMCLGCRGDGWFVVVYLEVMLTCSV